MRLIDADKLKEYVNNKSTHPLCEWDTAGVLMAIDEQETALDVDNLIKRLKDAEYNHTYFGRDMAIDTDTAIDIVEEEAGIGLYAEGSIFAKK